jgi:hypothetical protein
MPDSDIPLKTTEKLWKKVSAAAAYNSFTVGSSYSSINSMSSPVTQYLQGVVWSGVGVEARF